MMWIAEEELEIHQRALEIDGDVLKRTLDRLNEGPGPGTVL
jgi:hypothetical protein